MSQLTLGVAVAQLETSEWPKAASESPPSPRVQALMSDFGGEFTSLRLEEYFKELGIHVVPHMPQQNGRAEKSEAVRHQACLPMLRQRIQGLRLTTRLWNLLWLLKLWLFLRAKLLSILGNGAMAQPWT